VNPPKPPAVPGHARLIAIANQKGGVGKSTTAVSLGAALAELGFRVLVVDLDPQGNASTGMGIRHEARDTTVYDVLVAEAPIEDAIVPTPTPGLEALPSTIDLAGAEIELVSQFSREGRLKRALEPIKEGRFDFVLLDCPPSLGLLTVNALTAAEELIVPIQCEYYALEGLGQLLRNVNLVQQNINPGLRLAGIVMTMFDPRTKLSEQVVAEVQRFFGDLVYDVIIPRTVRLSEAPGYGQPITMYDPKSKGAECYRQLAREVAGRPPPDTPMPRYDDLPTVVVPATTGSRAGAREAREGGDADTAEGGASAEADVPEPVGVREGSEDAAEIDGRAIPTVHEIVNGVRPPGAASATAEHDPNVAITEPAATEPAPTTPAATRSKEPPRTTAQDDELWEDVDEPPDHRVHSPASPPEAGHLPERRVVVIDEDPEIDIRASREPLVDPRHRSAGENEADAEPAATNIGATLEDDDARKRRWRLFRKGGE
jgi:chromosome partitioning protein